MIAIGSPMCYGHTVGLVVSAYNEESFVGMSWSMIVSLSLDQNLFARMALSTLLFSMGIVSFTLAIVFDVQGRKQGITDL